MRYDLAGMIRRQNPNLRRKSIVFRDITAPATMATDLYRACYKPVIDAWVEALPAIEAEYARTLSTITTDSPADVAGEVDSAAAQVNRLVLLLTPELRRWSLRVEKHVRDSWRGAVLSASKVDLTTMLGPEDMRQTLETVVQWNTSLIRDVTDQVRQRVGSAVFDGLRNRTPARDVAKTIQEATNLGRKRSLSIAADQTSKLTASLADERRREAGISDWEWVWSQKKNGREAHIARNGNYYTDAPSQVGQVVNGKTLLKPPEDRPGQLPWCGCRTRSVIDLSK